MRTSNLIRTGSVWPRYQASMTSAPWASRKHLKIQEDNVFSQICEFCKKIIYIDFASHICEVRTPMKGPLKRSQALKQALRSLKKFPVRLVVPHLHRREPTF